MKRALALGLAVGAVLSARPALALGPWVDRDITLPGHDWSFDFGLGVGHGGNPGVTGAGINAEMAVSPIDRLELGLRTGIRFGDDGQALHADEYGRLYDRQTFGAGSDTFANPELRVTGEVVRTPIVDLALEGRVSLPFAPDSHGGVMFGMPVNFHLGRIVRLDTGVYVPAIFSSPVDVRFSAPLDVWIQAAPRVFLGPMTGFVYDGNSDTVDISLGFGFGYQILRTLDLKTMLLFPAINQDNAREFGIGVGIQVRIE